MDLLLVLAAYTFIGVFIAHCCTWSESTPHAKPATAIAWPVIVGYVVYSIITRKCTLTMRWGNKEYRRERR